MTIDTIRLTCFRNHHASELIATRHFNLLTGDNGAGKTNVLEAISLLAPGRGLRRAALCEMSERSKTSKSDHNNGFSVSAELRLPGLPAKDSETVRLGTGTRADRPGRRLVRINSAGASALALSEWLSIFWLTPSMDRLFTDTPSARRRFLDRLVLTQHPSHAACAARYEAALRERNRLLALPGEPDSAWLDAIESPMAEAGAALVAARANLVEILDEALRAVPEAPFARPALALVPGGPMTREALCQMLADTRRRDRAAGRTLIGPHRDDLSVILASKNQNAAVCSTGEQKAMLIAIVLAHSTLLHDAEEKRRPRLLLLDEVAAHLDPMRRAALFERLDDTEAQIWLTGTEVSPFSALAGKAAHWRVSDGMIVREDG